MPPACDTHSCEKSTDLNCGMLQQGVEQRVDAREAGGTVASSAPRRNLPMSRGLGTSVRCDPQRMASRHKVSAKM